jgi:hypothetical protein
MIPIVDYNNSNVLINSAADVVAAGVVMQREWMISSLLVLRWTARNPDLLGRSIMWARSAASWSLPYIGRQPINRREKAALNHPLDAAIARLYNDLRSPLKLVPVLRSNSA